MEVFVARHVDDLQGWFVISGELFADYQHSDEYKTAMAYRCFHCGIILKTRGVVVHQDSCDIGSDERLNESLFMLNYCVENAKANDGLGARVETDVLGYLSRYRKGE